MPLASASTERFPKSLRLRRRAEFLAVQQQGEKIAVGALLAVVRGNQLGVTRVGLTVSTKVGNAVVRSRIRRWLRELFRKRRLELPAGLDVVLIARSAAATADFSGVEKAFEAVVERVARKFA